MRLSVVLFLSLILYISIANAKQQTNNVSIKQLIQKVKSSTGDNRRVAMNTLKVKLRSMNQETRQQVMHDLQKSFSGKQNQYSRQRAIQTGTSQRGNTGSMQPPASGGMHINPSQTPVHSSPVTIPHQPAPSVPQIPHTQPSSPQMPSPGMPSPHFGQPGGHK